MEEDVKKEEKKNNFSEKLRENPWILSTFVLGIFVAVLLIGSVGSFSFTGNVISANEAGTTLMNLYQAGGITGLSVDSVKDISGLYQVNLLYQGGVVPVYITKDGKYAGSLTPVDDSTSNAGINSGTGSYSGNVNVSEDNDAVLGNKNAPVTIIEFSDYQCPFCEKFWTETLPSIKSKYINTGKVKLVYRDFPLTSIHPLAEPAAEAAECVRKAAKGSDAAYFKYHDKIFGNQQDLGEDNLKLWAKQLGYDISSCLDSGEMRSEVQSDEQDGAAAGVSGTPAFFINGISVSGAQPFSVFEQIIEGELSKTA